MSQRWIRHYWCFDLFWCFTEESQFLGWNHIQVRASPPFRIQQTAKVSMLTETTLKQLDVLSEIVWLMCKPNKRSKRLKANIVGWTPSAVSVNLSFSELQPKQIQILRSGIESRRRYVHRHTHAHTQKCNTHTQKCNTHRFQGQFGVHALLCEWCPGGCGEAERGLSSALLLCLPWWFPDASEWSECYGTLGKQPSSLGLEPAGQD